MNTVIIIVGNPIDGFGTYGPFETHEDAERWAENLDEGWWITTMINPLED